MIVTDYMARCMAQKGPFPAILRSFFDGGIVRLSLPAHSLFLLSKDPLIAPIWVTCIACRTHILIP